MITHPIPDATIWGYIKEALFGEGGVLRVRGLIVLGVTGVTLAMFFRGVTLPDELLAAWIAIVSTYTAARFMENGNGKTPPPAP